MFHVKHTVISHIGVMRSNNEPDGRVVQVHRTALPIRASGADSRQFIFRRATAPTTEKPYVPAFAFLLRRQL